MIRDRIVVGIRDAKLSERLQLNPNLDLATAILQVRQHEEVKKQQVVLRLASTQGNLDAVSHNIKRPAYRKKSTRHVSNFQPQSTSTKSRQCGKCGKTPTHAWTECPAKDVECRKCQKKGHFAAVCRSAQKLESIEEDGAAAYLGAVDHPQSSTWTEMLIINGGQLRFKVDTGASVTAIPESVYTVDKYGSHRATGRPLLGPANQPLEVKVHAVIQRGDRKIEEEVFIVKDLTIPLLGLPAIRRLHMIPQLHSIDDAESLFRSTYPGVFKGLGNLKGEYKIKLKNDAVPYALSAPR